MKLIVLGACLISSMAFSQTNAKIECGNSIAYRPGGSTLEEASHGFQTELINFLNNCEVQKLVEATDTNFYIKSFSQEDGVSTLKYDKIEFKDGVASKTLTCTLVQIRTPVKNEGPSELPASAIAKFETRHSQECLDKNNPRSFICRTDWINCMPGGAKGNEKYCTKEYVKWSKENCGGSPRIAM